ncbi:MAG: hypothetical protein LUC06_06850 [Oscillospiraceae bacterium]|nr:hypothetical protein [Oscillospiraceae bacterium]
MTNLFSDTIKNNLRLGNPSATDADIREVCKLCAADSFITALPLGYDTPLDENGANLSPADSGSTYPSPARFCAVRSS